MPLLMPNRINYHKHYSYADFSYASLKRRKVYIDGIPPQSSLPVPKGRSCRIWSKHWKKSPKHADALILLKGPTYITHIQVYTDSAITEPLIEVATDKSLSGPLQFIPIKDPQIGKPIKPGQMRRFRVGQKIRYLRRCQTCQRSDGYQGCSLTVFHRRYILGWCNKIRLRFWAKEVILMDIKRICLNKSTKILKP